MIAMQSFFCRAALVLNVAPRVVQGVAFPAIRGLTQALQESTARATPTLQTWPDPTRLPAINIPGSNYVLRIDVAWSARIDKQEYLDFLVGFTRNLRRQYPPTGSHTVRSRRPPSGPGNFDSMAHSTASHSVTPQGAHDRNPKCHSGAPQMRSPLGLSGVEGLYNYAR